MRNVTTRPTQRPLRRLEDRWGVGAAVEKDVGRKRERESVDVCVYICGKEREGGREGEQVRETAWGTKGGRKREREREPSQGKRLALCSPVVRTRWCSLIIHCVRWMSLSRRTTLLHSALCLGAPGGRDGGGGGRGVAPCWAAAQAMHGLRLHFLNPCRKYL